MVYRRSFVVVELDDDGDSDGLYIVNDGPRPVDDVEDHPRPRGRRVTKPE